MAVFFHSKNTSDDVLDFGWALFDTEVEKPG